MGLEPTTPCLKGRCSNRLSYGPTTMADGEITPYIIRKLAKKSMWRLVFVMLRMTGLGPLHPEHQQTYQGTNANDQVLGTNSFCPE